jgi:CHASE1-domain containing sensor protein
VIKVIVPLVLIAGVVLVALVVNGTAARQGTHRVRKARLDQAEAQAQRAEDFIEELREEVWSMRDASPVCDVLLGKIRDYQRGAKPQDRGSA